MGVPAARFCRGILLRARREFWLFASNLNSFLARLSRYLPGPLGLHRCYERLCHVRKLIELELYGLVSRFCVFCIRNTMRNVTIVVPVLITAASEKERLAQM